MLAHQQIGPYQVIRLIGEGGMGIVYEGIHQTIHRRVAIKILHSEYARDREMAKRFINEARAVNYVDHPGVVQVSDYGHLEDGTAYIVMEYLKGDTLADRIQKLKNQIPMYFILQVSWQLADALSAAHSASIVHRDLKPRNVMLVPDPYNPLGERAKLLDFGIAKSSFEPGKSAITRSDVVMGTPMYMSPEQCEGAGKVDDRSDVYSLGVMLYELLTGSPPFVAEGPGRVISMHLFQQPEPVNKRAPQTPVVIAELVHRLLSKDRESRPRMREVATALDGLARAYPPPPRPSGAPTLMPHSEQLPTATGQPAEKANIGVVSTLGRVASQKNARNFSYKLRNKSLIGVFFTLLLSAAIMIVANRTRKGVSQSGNRSQQTAPIYPNTIGIQPDLGSPVKTIIKPRVDPVEKVPDSNMTVLKKVVPQSPVLREPGDKVVGRSDRKKPVIKKDRLAPLPNSYFSQ